MSQTRSSGSTILSPLQQLARLPETERANFLQGLSDEQAAALAYQWDGWQARPNQVPPPDPWRFWLVMAGRGFGKTRIGAEELRKAAQRYEFPNLIGATADDARDIMIEGESGILAVCPPWERPTYLPSKRRLDWPSGAKSLIFTADEPERLRGKQHQWIWADELAAWRYPESWTQAMLGTRLPPDPRVVITTTPKPTELVRKLIAHPHCVVTRGSTYDNLENLAEAFAEEIIAEYEGTRLGRQELLGELLDDEGLAYPYDERVHVIRPFAVPPSFERFEHMDFGSSDSSATAWYVTAVDYDGNLIVLDGFYEPGLPSETAPKILALREQGWEVRDEHGQRLRNLVYADPAIFNPGQVANRWGDPAVVADEFSDCGIRMSRANNDRRAGYVRIATLLRQDPEHRYPAWHSRAGGSGAPRMFIFDVPGTQQLRDALRWAPLEEADPGPYHGPYPGEAVAVKWEGRKGHAHAALRYGVMSRPRPSETPDQPLDDPRADMLARLEELRDGKQAGRKFSVV